MQPGLTPKRIGASREDNPYQTSKMLAFVGQSLPDAEIVKLKELKYIY